MAVVKYLHARVTGLFGINFQFEQKFDHFPIHARRCILRKTAY